MEELPLHVEPLDLVQGFLRDHFFLELEQILFVAGHHVGHRTGVGLVAHFAPEFGQLALIQHLLVLASLPHGVRLQKRQDACNECDEDRHLEAALLVVGVRQQVLPPQISL